MDCTSTKDVVRASFSGNASKTASSPVMHNVARLAKSHYINDILTLRPCRNPSRGVGLFARKAIRAYTSMFGEAPIRVWDSRKQAMKTGYKDCNEISFDKRMALMLIRAGPDDIKGPFTKPGITLEDAFKFLDNKSRIQKIIQFNGFELRDSGRVGHYVLSEKSCRLNHSCRPNAFLSYDSDRDKVGLYAIRDINKGDEVTISYLEGDPTLPRARRQQTLKQKYGFECQCKLCTTESPENDVIRSQINKAVKDIDNLFSTSMTEDEIKEAIDLQQSVNKFLRTEGIVSLFALTQERRMAKLLWYLGHQHRAWRCAVVAASLSRACLGADHLETRWAVKELKVYDNPKLTKASRKWEAMTRYQYGDRSTDIVARVDPAGFQNN